MRFVCDFRGLNNMTKKDSHPLPHIRDIIDDMQDVKYWTTLDEAGVYWFMPLDANDKEKTFEFNVALRPHKCWDIIPAYDGYVSCWNIVRKDIGLHGRWSYSAELGSNTKKSLMRCSEDC